MAQRNDSIFQLSLTEIAFTITFILLLLLGYLVFKEESARLVAESALAKVQTFEQATTALNTAKGTLAIALQRVGTPNPDEVITKLIAVDEVRAERDRLKQKVEDLDAKLTALTELQNQLEKTVKANRPDVMKEAIDSALSLQEKVLTAIKQAPSEKELSNEQRNKKALNWVNQAISTTGELKLQLKKQLNKELTPGREAKIVQDVVSDAKGFVELNQQGSRTEVINSENADLRGQVAFLKNRLDARGGRDFPPCWADESGKVEFLFSIEMKPDSVMVTPAWPLRREASALALPGITEILAGSHSNQKFVSSIQDILSWSKKQNPECRHYVKLKSYIADAIQSDRARLMVENYFYKVEVRR